MDSRWRQQISLFLAASVLQSCVSVHAPLLPDEEYPRDWGEFYELGAECKGVEGTYLNAGELSGVGANSLPVSLTSVLNLPIDAKSVSLSTQTRRVDQNGDAFITLHAVSHGDTTVPFDLEGCFCIKQTLVCTQISEEYWGVPNFGFGGSQRNIYVSVSQDRSLIAKLQNYHADFILVVPVFGMEEPWARFKNANQ